MDKDTIYLKNGATYFLACLSQTEPRVPIIHTLIYRGIDEEHGHLFEGVGDKDKGFICYPSKIAPNLLDLEALIAYLPFACNPRTTLKSYEYKSI